MAKHRLVALGDSLTQGFMSGAVFATDLSYPAMIAQALGIDSSQFRFPAFNAHGGLPVNIEMLLRRLEQQYGADLDTLELLGAPFQLRTWMDEVEDYWERGAGTQPMHTAGTFHNLASWGMTVDDALYLTAGYCAQRCQEPTTDNLFNQVPENSFFRTALTVLNPAQQPERMDRTALGCARDLAADGGIENLIVALGANNALGTVTRLNVTLTDDRVLADPLAYRNVFNLWRPEHFASLYRNLADELDAIGAERVFLATVPHVTIVPLARGVGTTRADRLPDDPRYFKFYTYFWITDQAFDPTNHPYLTGAQAKEIDATIDTYNATIRQVVTERQARGQQWFIVDLGGALERIAYRRYREIGLEPPGGPYEYPAGWLAALQAEHLPQLTSQYLGVENGQIVRGGLFSLDGVHATTMGYSLLAHEFISVMHQAGVPFINPVTQAARPDPLDLDYARFLRRDTLVRRPPGLFDDGIRILNWLEDWVGVGSLLAKVY